MDKRFPQFPTQSIEEMAIRILSYLEDDPQDDNVPYFNSEEELYYSALDDLRENKLIAGRLIDEIGSTHYNKSSILVYRITSAGKEYLSRLKARHQKK